MVPCIASIVSIYRRKGRDTLYLYSISSGFHKNTLHSKVSVGVLSVLQES